MADKKHEQSGFKVTDRRLFTSEGELRADLPEEVEAPKAPSPSLPKDAPIAGKPPAPGSPRRWKCRCRCASDSW